MNAVASIFLAIATGALAVPVHAQFAKAEDAIRYRQSGMFMMGQHLGRIGAMANGRVPFDAKVAAENADLLAALAKLPYAGFMPGSEKGAPTKAKPEIWTEPAKFQEGVDKIAVETARLAAAAKSGDLERLKAAFASTADTCKACHDTYRSK